MKDIEKSKHHKIMTKLRKKKEMLSANRKARFQIENFYEDMPLSATISRLEFEQSCMDYYDKMESNLRHFKSSLEMTCNQEPLFNNAFS